MKLAIAALGLVAVLSHAVSDMDQVHAAQAMGIEGESMQLGMELMEWARATELQSLARLGVHPEQSKFIHCFSMYIKLIAFSTKSYL